MSAGSPIAQSIADNLNLLPGVFQPPAPPSWSNLQVGRFSRYAQGASYAFYNEQAAQHRPLITQLRDPLAAAAIARQSPSLDRQAAAVVGAVIRNGGPTGAAVRGSTVT